MRLGIRGMLAFGLFGLLATAGGVAAVLTGQLLGAEAAGQVQRQQRLRALELSDAVAAACASNAGAACEAEIGTLARAQDDFNATTRQLAERDARVAGQATQLGRLEADLKSTSGQLAQRNAEVD